MNPRVVLWIVAALMVGVVTVPPVRQAALLAGAFTMDRVHRLDLSAGIVS